MTQRKGTRCSTLSGNEAKAANGKNSWNNGRQVEWRDEKVAMRNEYADGEMKSRGESKEGV